MSGKAKSFQQRISDGETILIAEGYVFEFERRGYLKAGAFVPEVVLEHPELVLQLHREYVHAGSDVVQAFTYYGHREKLRVIGREDVLEPMNRKALQMARQVADETGTLMAGNICNTTVYDYNNPESFQQAERIFKEQIEWAVEEGADLIIAETFPDFGEAELALKCIQKYSDLPSIVNVFGYCMNKTRDGYSFPEALKKLEDQGATVVGINCATGPETILKTMRGVREVCKGPLAALPVPYRTTDKEPSFLALTLPDGKLAFPLSLDHFYCKRDDFYKFGKECMEIGIQVCGICCGNSSRHFRRLAEAVGRHPPACKYSPNMSQHYIFGTDSKLRDVNTVELREKILHSGEDAQ